MNVQDNEHAMVHELRGFLADDLFGAFHEAEAVSLVTQCQQHLFSLSLSPSQSVRVYVEAFETAIADIECGPRWAAPSSGRLMRIPIWSVTTIDIWSNVQPGPRMMNSCRFRSCRRHLQSVQVDDGKRILCLRVSDICDYEMFAGQESRDRIMIGDCDFDSEYDLNTLAPVNMLSRLPPLAVHARIGVDGVR